MDKSRLSNAEKLKVCQLYYKLGFFGLPAIWAVNYFWFYEEACSHTEFDEQKEIRRLRRRSGIGAAVWLVAITLWVIIFQTSRVKWGAFGDHISFIVPTGSP